MGSVTCLSSAGPPPTVTISRMPSSRMAMTEVAGLKVPVPSVASLLPPRWYNSRFSILNSQFFWSSQCELLVLFQVKKSVKSLLGLVSKKSLSKDVPKTFQKPLQDDGLFLTEAAPSPPAAAPGILLFSLASVDSCLF